MSACIDLTRLTQQELGWRIQSPHFVRKRICEGLPNFEANGVFLVSLATHGFFHDTRLKCKNLLLYSVTEFYFH